jgi:hypothetical protein
MLTKSPMPYQDMRAVDIYLGISSKAAFIGGCSGMREVGAIASS